MMIITDYSSSHPREDESILEEMLEALGNANLSEEVIWNQINQCRASLYDDRFLPKFLWKNDLDKAFENIFEHTYPLKRIKAELNQLLHDRQRDQGHAYKRLKEKVRNVEEKNAFLEAELENMHTLSQTVIRENELLNKENIGLKEENTLLINEVIELKKVLSESATGECSLKKEREWKMQLEALTQENHSLAHKASTAEEELRILQEKIQEISLENMELKQKNALLAKDNRAKSGVILNLKSSQKLILKNQSPQKEPINEKILDQMKLSFFG